MKSLKVLNVKSEAINGRRDGQKDDLHHTEKHWAIWTRQKRQVEIRCSGRAISSCSTSGTRRVIFITSAVKIHGSHCNLWHHWSFTDSRGIHLYLSLFCQVIPDNQGRIKTYLCLKHRPTLVPPHLPLA